jgi:hypothetical protein
MKIRAVGTELFPWERTGMTKQTVSFRIFFFRTLLQTASNWEGRPASGVVAVPTVVCFEEVRLSDLSCLQTAVAGYVL